MNRKGAKGAKFLLLFLIGAPVKCATLSFRISLGKQPIRKDNTRRIRDLPLEFRRLKSKGTAIGLRLRFFPHTTLHSVIRASYSGHQRTLRKPG
jgi:hypothetical protein